MTSGRDHLRQARRKVHAVWRVPALYVARTGATPVRVGVRPQVRFDESAPPGSDPIHLADKTPRIKFLRTEVAVPDRGALVVVSEAEIYLVDHCRPPDDEWIVAEVTQLSRAKLAAAWDADYAALLA